MRYDQAAEWERFGLDEPYFGVLSSDPYRRQNLDAAALERFWASGEEHVERVLAWARAEGDPGFAPGAVLDHGCGVGRLLVPFARRAGRVVGVDVSPSMLAEARRNLDARGLTGVELREAAALRTLEPEYDLVHSFLVLQHVAPREGLGIAGALADLLRPGGVGVLHVPLRAGSPFDAGYQWVRRRVPFARNLANRARGRPWDHPDMQMHAYRLDRLLGTLDAHGVDAVRIRLVRLGEDPRDVSAVLSFRRSLGTPPM